MGLVIPLFLMSFSDNMLSKNDSLRLSREKVLFCRIDTRFGNTMMLPECGLFERTVSLGGKPEIKKGVCHNWGNALRAEIFQILTKSITLCFNI